MARGAWNRSPTLQRWRGGEARLPVPHRYKA